MAAFGSTTRATLHHRMEAANAAAAREARAREAMAVLTASGAGADGAALLAAGLAVNVTKTEVEKIPFIDLDVHLDFDQPVHVWIDCLTGIATLADDVERFLFLMEPEATTGVAAQLVTKNLAGRFRAIFTHDAEILRAPPRRTCGSPALRVAGRPAVGNVARSSQNLPKSPLAVLQTLEPSGRRLS